MLNHQSNLQCLGVILAGGASSRMGTDKALLQWQGQTLLSRAKQLLIDVGVDDIMISGANHGIADLLPNIGPMGGIHTALEHYQTQSLLVLPIDLPFLTAPTLKQLKMKGELSQKATFFEEHFLPLYLPNTAYSEAFLASVNQCKNDVKNTGKKAGPSIRQLLKQVPHQALKLQDSQQLFNANSQQDWQVAQKIN